VWWWDYKCEYFYRLSQELFACWLYLRVYPEHGTLNANFPPFETKPIDLTKPGDLIRQENIKASKIIPWEKDNRKQAFDKDIENFVRDRLNSSFITDKMLSYLQDHPNYVVDAEFMKELNHNVYDLFPFGFDYRKIESFLNLSIVSNKMWELYNMLGKIKIENGNTDCVVRAKDLVRYAESRISHELIVDANLLLGYYIGKGLISLRRIKKATDTKRSKRAVKEKYVIEAYTQMINEEKKTMLKNLSENKMAQLIKKRVEADLKKVKTSGHHPVLKPKVGRNEIVTCTGLSTKTIIDILRKRNKDKLPFYPWAEKNPSRT
jgi:hypothetical protein